MQVRVAGAMLAVLVVALLAPSVTEGLVLTRCQLRQQLNQIVPENMTNMIAKIVCYAELASNLSTSKVTNISSLPNLPFETHNSPKPTNPPNPPKKTNEPPKKPNGRPDKEDKPRKPRSPKSKPDLKPSKDDHAHPSAMPNSVSPNEPPKDRNETSRETNDHSDHGKEVRPRKSRSPKPKPDMKPSKDDHAHPSAMPNSASPNKPSKNPNEPSREPNNHSEHGKEVKPRKSRSPKSKADRPVGKPEKPHDHDDSHESIYQGNDVWTLYGVFQLPDHVACDSGNNNSSNLCGLTCDKLTDDDITDDIACGGTLISKFKSVETLKDYVDKLSMEKLAKYIGKLYGQVNQQCANLDATQFFSGC